MTYTSVLSALQLNRVGAQLDRLKKTQSNGQLLRTKARSVQKNFWFFKTGLLCYYMAFYTGALYVDKDISKHVYIAYK